MKKVFLIVIFPVYVKAESASRSVWEACRRSKEIEVCKHISDTIHNIEENVEKKLESLGAKDAAVVTASTANALIQKKVKLKTGRWGPISNDRSVIEINEDQFKVEIEWRF